MRKPAYLSPSNVKLFFEDREAWYIQYLSPFKVPRDPQTRPMSVGSAFDAYVKAYLHETLFGKGADPRFEFTTLFESQVEKHNRVWAKDAGKYVYECYKRSGALADLMLELNQAVGNPRFEIEIQSRVGAERVRATKGISILGKPDVFFMNKHGKIVILDWKVNGYCGNGNTSPSPGYVRLRNGSGENDPGKAHKNCVLGEYQGMIINTATTLECVNEGWAEQVATYGWLCGAEIGDEFVTCIDQIVGKNMGGIYPQLRIAEHRTKVSKEFQEFTFDRFHKVHNAIETGLVFDDMGFEENKQRMETLDRTAERTLERLDGKTTSEPCKIYIPEGVVTKEDSNEQEQVQSPAQDQAQSPAETGQ